MSEQMPQPPDGSSVSLPGSTGPILVEPVPVPTGRKRPMGGIFGSLVPRRKAPECLALEQQPESRSSRFRISVELAGIFLLLAGICFGLVVLVFGLLDGDAALESQPWTWVIDIVLAFHYLSGLLGILIFGGLFRLLRAKGTKHSKRHGMGPVFASSALIGLGAAGFAYVHDRSIFDLGLWGELTALAGAELFFALGAAMLMFTRLTLLDAWLHIFHIEINLRSGCVARHENYYGFPKYQCATREIVAVQVLGGIEQASTFFQVNLVLDNTNRQRLNLAEYPAATAAREVGSSVAEFLHVPLVDQVQAER